MRCAIKAGLRAGVMLAVLSSAPTALSQSIEVATLDAVDPFEVGLSSTVPDTVWSRTDAGALSAALSGLPDRQGAGWTRDEAARLALRALRASGAPPMDGARDFELAALRADRMMAAGGAGQAFELLLRTPQINDSNALSQIFADAAFAVGESSEACRAANALLEGRESAYWLRVRAACLALDGAIPAAELTAELARAQSPDPAFDQIFDAFTLGRAAPEDVTPRTGLELALISAAAPGVRVTPADDAPAWLLKASERTGPQIGLPETLPEALETAASLTGVERAVALGALIQQDLDREIAAEALAMRLADAAQIDRFVEAAAAYGPEVSDLPITENTLAHGVAFVLAALVVDDVIAAERWREALLDGPPPPEPVYTDALDPQGLPDLDAGPGALTPPASAQTLKEGPDWRPPAASIRVALDFARAIALDEVRSDAFMALLAARLETVTPERVCQAAGLVALGADDRGQLRQALSGLTRDEAVPAPAFGPVMLAAGAGALGEVQLHAARLLDQHGDDAETCAVTALALDHAGLRGQALRYLLERVIEEAA